MVGCLIFLIFYLFGQQSAVVKKAIYGARFVTISSQEGQEGTYKENTCIVLMVIFQNINVRNASVNPLFVCLVCLFACLFGWWVWLVPS